MDIRTLTLIHKLLTAEYDAAKIEHDIAHNTYLITKRERDRGERDEIPAEIDAAYRAAAKRAGDASHALSQFEDHDWT